VRSNENSEGSQTRAIVFAPTLMLVVNGGVSVLKPNVWSAEVRLTLTDSTPDIHIHFR